MITVVAALIQQDGRLLICQRRATDAFSLKWEFPGGKVEPSESAADALLRELREELGIACRRDAVGSELYRARHRYAEPRDELELIFYPVQLLASASAATAAQPVRNLAFAQIRWVEPARLGEFDFLPADRELVALLSSGALRVP